jgi:hypothetical protein
MTISNRKQRERTTARKGNQVKDHNSQSTSVTTLGALLTAGRGSIGETADNRDPFDGFSGKLLRLLESLGIRQIGGAEAVHAPQSASRKSLDARKASCLCLVLLLLGSGLGARGASGWRHDSRDKRNKGE